MSAAPRTLHRLGVLRGRARTEARNIISLMTKVAAASAPDEAFDDDIFTAHVELFVSHIDAIDTINEQTQ